MSNEGIFSKKFQVNKIKYSPNGYYFNKKRRLWKSEKNIIYFSRIIKDKSYQNKLFGIIMVLRNLNFQIYIKEKKIKEMN